MIGGASLDTCDSTPDPICGDDQCELGLVDVHQSHIDQDLVVIAELCQAALDPDAVPLLRARQVVLPESHFCRCHRSAQPRLDRPGANLSGGSNRAERRSRRRPRRA